MYIHEIGRMLALPYGAADTGPIASDARVGFCAQRAMAGQKLRQVRTDRDRTDARAAAAVRNAERLVQIQMRNIGAEFPRRGEPDQRIEVRAVDVDLAAVGVNDVADVPDAGLEHAVRRRIGDHDRGQVGAMRFGLRLAGPARSTLPSSSHATTTTFMPAICADAGLVPCADAGIRQTLRCASPRDA